MYKCIQCEKELTLSQIKEGNKFCSSSCAATYNNKLRNGYKQENRNCLYCGKTFRVIFSDPKKFCNNVCSGNFYNKLRKPSDLVLKVLKDKKIIESRFKTETLFNIALDYGCSANYIKDTLKGRYDKYLPFVFN